MDTGITSLAQICFVCRTVPASSLHTAPITSSTDSPRHRHCNCCCLNCRTSESTVVSVAAILGPSCHHCPSYCPCVCACVYLSLSLAIFYLPPKFRTLGVDTELVSLKLKRNFLCRISEVPQFLSRSGSAGFFFLLKNKQELLLKKKSGCLELSEGLGWTTTTATTNQPTNKQFFTPPIL
jgi:hypothetical protein